MHHARVNPLSTPAKRPPAKPSVLRTPARRPPPQTIELEERLCSNNIPGFLGPENKGVREENPPMQHDTSCQAPQLESRGSRYGVDFRPSRLDTLQTPTRWLPRQEIDAKLHPGNDQFWARNIPPSIFSPGPVYETPYSLQYPCVVPDDILCERLLETLFKRYSEDHMTYGRVIAFERLVNRIQSHYRPKVGSEEPLANKTDSLAKGTVLPTTNEAKIAALTHSHEINMMQMQHQHEMTVADLQHEIRELTQVVAYNRNLSATSWH